MIAFQKQGYSEALVKRFSDIVIFHIETLPVDYYRMMREYTEGGNVIPPGEASIQALGFDFADDYKKMFSAAELVGKYVQLEGASLSKVVADYETETIGVIDGVPVLFCRGSGQYLYEREALAGVLSLWLTGAFYPPVLPNRTKTDS